MNLEVELLKTLLRLFEVLNAFIEDYSVYLYLGLVWLALAIIAWVINRDLRKGMKPNAARIIPVVIIVAQSPRQPESPTIDIEVEQMGNDDGK